METRYDGDPVVIKRMKYSVGVGDYVIQAFKKEAAIFARLNHARIVRFFGVITEQGCISLILEDMSHGSLLDFYKAQPEASVQDRVQWALDIAFGMQYLHTRTPPIIHRDLKSPNVLMALEGNGSLRAKVTDFGSAVLQLATATRMHSKQPTLAGTTLFWRAPELSGFRLKVLIFTFLSRPNLF
ncbi:kinase-like domain-containing protein [Chytridium lagenaria]|nr:kinase-like domain-containing protein [Chytridium lagenaria]